MIDWLDLLGVQETLNARSKHILFTSECAGLISFRIDSFDLLAVRGTLKSLLENHSKKASVLCKCSIFPEHMNLREMASF